MGGLIGTLGTRAFRSIHYGAIVKLEYSTPGPTGPAVYAMMVKTSTATAIAIQVLSDIG